MAKTIVVTGGTGTLGRPLVRGLVNAGHQVRVLSRHAPDNGVLPAGVAHSAVDLRTGQGLEAALDGAEVVVHCAWDLRADEAVARNLLAAARAAGVGHVLYISIVGVDRIPIGFYKRKLAVERQVEASGLPWTILRTTQFHELIVSLLRAQRRLPVIFAPSVRFQPVDVGDVAARMTELALASPAGRLDDMGGPAVRDAGDLARAYRAATGGRRPIVPLRFAGEMWRQLRAGANLVPEHAVGVRGFDDYLAARFGR